jgi:hypothetical protein
MSSEHFDQNIMSLFRWVFARRPHIGEKNIYEITYRPEAMVVINSLSCAKILTLKKTIRYRKKLLFNTPRKLVANNGVHFFIAFMFLVFFGCFIR